MLQLCAIACLRSTNPVSKWKMFGNPCLRLLQLTLNASHWSVTHLRFPPTSWFPSAVINKCNNYWCQRVQTVLLGIPVSEQWAFLGHICNTVKYPLNVIHLLQLDNVMKRKWIKSTDHVLKTRGKPMTYMSFIGKYIYLFIKILFIIKFIIYVALDSFVNNKFTLGI